MNAIHPTCSLEVPCIEKTAAGSASRPCSWRRRLSAHWPMKLALLVIVTLIYKVVYVACQQAPWTVPRHWELTWIDRTIPFRPGWTWMYLSIYLMLPVVPFLTVGRGRLIAYLKGAALMSFVAFGFFYLVPVELPRPHDPSHHALYSALTALDRPLNCFPSMHVGFAVFSVLFLHRVRRAEWPELPVAWLWAAWSWAAAIIVSTLFTKQHYLIDLPAGAALAWISDRLAHHLPLQAAPFPPPVALPHDSQENQLPSTPVGV